MPLRHTACPLQNVASTRQRNFTTVNVGAGDAGGAIKTYIVNVKSAGPNRKFGGSDGYDDIWSYPDDFEDE